MKSRPGLLTFQMATKMDKNRLAAARIRVRYLLEQVEVFDEDGSPIALEWARMAMDEVYYLLNNARITHQVKDGDKLSEEQIDRARAYPMDQLFTFVHNNTEAFCHTDKRPSLFWAKRTNTVICPVCDLKFDTIKVLMIRDGRPFRDAVLALQ